MKDDSALLKHLATTRSRVKEASLSIAPSDRAWCKSEAREAEYRIDDICTAIECLAAAKNALMWAQIELMELEANE